VILLKPGSDALDVEVVLARQEEDLVPLHIGFQANCADAARIFLDNSLDWDSSKDFVANSVLLFKLLSHVLIVKLFKDLNVHAFNRGTLLPWVIVNRLIFKDSLPFVVPIDEV